MLKNELKMSGSSRATEKEEYPYENIAGAHERLVDMVHILNLTTYFRSNVSSCLVYFAKGTLQRGGV
jgi:hypothetical protein